MAIYLSFNKQYNLEGIATDVHVKDKGASQVSSFQFGVALGVSVTKGGVEKSSPNVSEVALSKNFDAMSPALFSVCTLGKTIDTAVIEFVGAAGDDAAGSVAYLTYTLTNVVVTSWSTSSGGDKPVETITLAFEAIEQSYNTPPKTAKNKLGQPVVQKFSIVENKKA